MKASKSSHTHVKTRQLNDQQRIGFPTFSNIFLLGSPYIYQHPLLTLIICPACLRELPRALELLPTLPNSPSLPLSLPLHLPPPSLSRPLSTCPQYRLIFPSLHDNSEPVPSERLSIHFQSCLPNNSSNTKPTLFTFYDIRRGKGRILTH